MKRIQMTVGDSDEDFIYFKEFSMVGISEGFSIRDILYYQMWRFFLTETFILNLCSFNIAENANNVETAFWKKCKYFQSFHF